MNKWKAAVDLVGALIAHVAGMIFWLLFFVGVGTSLPAIESPVLYRPLDWLFNVGPFVLWGAVGVMLVVWWWQGRRPVWPYPIFWALAFAGTFFTLIALCFPQFRKTLRLRPPPLMPTRSVTGVRLE